MLGQVGKNLLSMAERERGTALRLSNEYQRVLLGHIINVMSCTPQGVLSEQLRALKHT